MSHAEIKIAVSSEFVRADKATVWEKLGFYEHVSKRPPWLLRTVLPTPKEVEGSHNAVGDLCRCRYSDGGYLTKRITKIVPQEMIEFEIVEQSIRYQNSIKLLGGVIALNEYEEGQCAITMQTFFASRLNKYTYLSCAIKRVIRAMHQFVISDLQEQLSGQESSTLVGNASY